MVVLPARCPAPVGDRIDKLAVREVTTVLKSVVSSLKKMNPASATRGPAGAKF
jgi:hypothetical protein